MNKQLIVAAVGALILPLSFVAKADGVTGGTEFTVYGRVVAGLDREDSDVRGESATWDFGATQAGSRNQQSRLGFESDRDLGNGMSAGFKLEQGFDAGGGLNGSRHRYVYLSGGFGKLTLGNDGTMYDSTGYDGSYFLGGAFRGSGRRDGIHYSNSMGPFSFGVTLAGVSGDSSAVATQALSRIADTDPMTDGPQAETDAAYITRLSQDDESEQEFIYRVSQESSAATRATLKRMTKTPGSGGVDRIADTDSSMDGPQAETDAAYIARLEALNRYAADNSDDSKAARIADEDIDRTIIGGSYDFGAFRLIAAYDGDNTDTSRDYTAISVKGDVGALSYQVGYETQDDATKGGENDHTVAGLFLAYSASENDTLYMEYETRDDDDMVAGGNEDASNTLLGYSHTFGGGAIFVAEYRSTDNDARNSPDPSRLSLAMIVNF